MFHKIYKLLAPFTCTLCDALADGKLDICTACYLTLPHNDYCCSACALPLERSALQSEDDTSTTLVCGACLTTPGPICEAIVPMLYRPPIDFMVKRLKYSSEMKFCSITGELIAENVMTKSRRPLPQALIPIPLHPDRLVERGYNQSVQIARIISKHLAIPVDTTSVQRITSQTPQSGLNARERDRNIKRAFHADTRVARQVAIIDDVYTTGATAKSLAKCLVQAGAIDVSLWAVARTP